REASPGHPPVARARRRAPPTARPSRPDPRAGPAAGLPWHTAAEEARHVPLLETSAIDWKDEKPPATIDEIAAIYEKSAAAVDEKLGRLDPAAWDQKCRFMVGGKTGWEDTLGQFMWGFLFDAVHHRGQLSTYLRPMGGKVPCIYGPSADDSGN